MHCEYCDVEVVEYPANGICVCCGGKLPPRPNVEPIPVPVQPVYIPVQQMPCAQTVYTCPKCHSTQVVPCKRGFSWGLGILGFFLFSILGILLGFCGRNKPCLRCSNCRHKWKSA